MRRFRIAAVVGGVLWLAAGSARAGIAFPARLDVAEIEPGVYEIAFTLPIIEGRKLRAEPLLPPTCVEASPREAGLSAGGLTATWSVRCEPASLAGEAILDEGLLGTQTDLAFKLTMLDGRSYSTILRPSRPGFLVPEAPPPIALAEAAVVEGARRTLRYPCLWLLLAAAALLGARPRELDTMRKIGSSRGRMRAILATEVLLVVFVSATIATALTAVVGRFGGAVVKLL